MLTHGDFLPLTNDEAAHARSILEPAVTRPIPSKRVARILCAVPVRKPPIVLKHLVQTVSWQRLRASANLDILFLPNFGDEHYAADALALLHAVPNATVLDNEAAPTGDYADGAETRQWTKPAFGRLAALKNRAIQEALDGGYDFLWLVDADVLCDPWTLQSLLDSADIERWFAYEGVYKPPIVAGVYWTEWQRRQPDSTDVVHAGPQVWLVHPYRLSGRGWTEPEFRRALVERKRLKVGGLGACTLIPRHALEKGVSFAPFDGLPPGPMAEGEDRHFCAWATAKHVPLIADGWPDIYHAYHPADYGTLPEEVAMLDVARPNRPRFGDLVSARIELLEPVVDQVGRMQRVQGRWLRGKLGALPVLPQIEEALASLSCGQSKLVKLHFPADWPEPAMRLQSRIARITLLDVKPFRLPPVIEGEFAIGGSSLRAIDATTLSERQVEELIADG